MSEPASRASFVRALENLVAREDEFRDLDAASGDGDLGITVRSTAAAALGCVAALSDSASPSTLLAALAKVCANTSPSTFASLVAHGLEAASKTLTGRSRLDVSSVADALRAGIAMVEKRGGARAGEKTFVDALLPALDALESSAGLGRAVGPMRLAAIRGTEQLVPDLPRRGRAAWVGERARGIPDAGSVVVIRFLEALEGADIVPWEDAWSEVGGG